MLLFIFVSCLTHSMQTKSEALSPFAFCIVLEREMKKETIAILVWELNGMLGTLRNSSEKTITFQGFENIFCASNTTTLFIIRSSSRFVFPKSSKPEIYVMLKASSNYCINDVFTHESFHLPAMFSLLRMLNF